MGVDQGTTQGANSKQDEVLNQTMNFFEEAGSQRSLVSFGADISMIAASRSPESKIANRGPFGAMSQKVKANQQASKRNESGQDPQKTLIFRDGENLDDSRQNPKAERLRISK